MRKGDEYLKIMTLVSMIIIFFVFGINRADDSADLASDQAVETCSHTTIKGDNL